MGQVLCCCNQLSGHSHSSHKSNSRSSTVQEDNTSDILGDTDDEEPTQHLLELAVKIVIAHKEKTKAERHDGPSEEVRNWWGEIAPSYRMKILEVPYCDPRNGAVVLHEEHFQRKDRVFWISLPWWASGIGFRVMQGNPPTERSVASILPPEVLLIICHHGQEDGDTKSIAQLALTCRAWDSKRQKFLFRVVKRGIPVAIAEVPAYVSLVANHSEDWSLYIKENKTSPDWFHRYLSLYAGARIRLLKADVPHQESKIQVKIDFSKVIPPQSPTRCRSLSFLSPKPLAPSSTSNLHFLALENYRFEFFSDLAHLLWELPFLRHVELTNISWKEFRGFIPPTLRVHLPTLTIAIKQCEDKPPFILLLTSLFKIPVMDNTYGILGSSDVPSLLSLLRSILELSLSSVISRNIILQRSNDQVVVRDHYSHTILEFELCQDLQDASYHLHIHSINLTLVYSELEKASLWSTIGEATLHMARGVDDILTIYFCDIPREGCVDYATVIVSQLPNMWKRGQIQFKRGRGDVEDGKWIWVGEMEDIFPTPV